MEVPRELLLVVLRLAVPTSQEVLLPILQVGEQAQDRQEDPTEVPPNLPYQEVAPSCLEVLQDLVDLAHYQDLLKEILLYNTFMKLSIESFLN